MSTGRPPRMDRLLAEPSALALAREYGPAETKRALREALDVGVARWRESGIVPGAAQVVGDAGERLREKFRPALRRVVNATGVVLHTNLGRAPLSRPLLREVSETLAGYVDLEMDLEAGHRGHRDAALERAFQALLDTDFAVVVVNNNAAATMLLLNTLSAGRETLVSRGELVEIGGGFRMPEVMKASGALLREVGTTNRTRLSDYRRAAGPQSGLLLKVHTSNFRILGFTEEVDLESLVGLGREVGLPVGFDLGSGLVDPSAGSRLPDEPPVGRALAARPDALCFSGDKLFGGCQAGILLVAPEHAPAFRSNPLLRALRVDKVTYALLAAVADRYRRGRLLEVPALALLGREEAELRRRAQGLLRRVSKSCPGRFLLEIAAAEGRSGAGSAPLTALPSPALAVIPMFGSTADLERHLRTGGDPPVVAQMSEDRILIHLRTLLPGDEGDLVRRLSEYGGGTP